MKKQRSPAKSSKIAEPGQFRIIGGKWRGRKLLFPAVTGLRPTPDRVRETVFNWLFDVSNLHCLDLFAGSGSLGLEALSRGASSCLFIDQSQAACQAINQHLQQLENSATASSKAMAQEVLSALNTLPQSARFSLVFLDPPYQLNCISECLQTLKERQLLDENAAIYIENSSQNAPISLPEGFSVLKEKQQGQVRFSLLSFHGD
jgi:16S rRNA (guanine966-N2)-methyltransferase